MELENDDIITLKSTTGEEIDFIEIAGIALKKNFYAILKPVQLIDGMNDNEALIFKVTKLETGEDHFSIELDDEIIDMVFEKYNELLDKQTQNNN